MGYSVYYGGEVNITPPLTEEHAAIVQALTEHDETEQTRQIRESIAANPEPEGWEWAGHFTVSEDGATILPEEDESRHGLGLWLGVLIEHFFRPGGYLLNGEISWEGEGQDDHGWIYVKDNQLEEIDDLIFNPGPSWSPNHFADSHSKQAIQELVESADNAGCSPDLTVVSAKSLEVLRRALAKL